MPVAFAAVLLQAPVLADPTFKELSKLVGGEWVGRGPKVEIHHKFEFAVDGKMIKGHGQVRVGGRVVLEMQPNMGWDPVAKQVSYVDFHDYDTVYMGHVLLKDGWMVYDFNEVARPKNHFSARSRFTDANHYEFLLGKEVIRMARQ